MNVPDRERPAEESVEGDFSVPEDADFTTPGDPVDDNETGTGGDGASGRTSPGNPLDEEK